MQRRGSRDATASPTDAVAAGPNGRPVRVDRGSADAHPENLSKMIQTRQVPDALHWKLKARVPREGQSLSDYLLAEMTRLDARPTLEEVVARLHRRSRVQLPRPAAANTREERDSA